MDGKLKNQSIQDLKETKSKLLYHINRLTTQYVNILNEIKLRKENENN